MGIIKNLSAHQSAIMDSLCDDDANQIWEAAAGAGKTSTIEHAIRTVLSDLVCLYLVFNRKNADEAMERLGDTEAMTLTLNSCGFRALQNARKYRLDKGKIWDCIKDAMPNRAENAAYGKIVMQLVNLARNEGIGSSVLADSDDAWQDIIEKYALDTDSANTNTYDCIRLARKVLAGCMARARKGSIDFCDMNYLPCVEGFEARWPSCDIVFVDEAQDLNAIQIENVAQIVEQNNARVVFVGDPWQAIYGFRGAVNEAMESLKKRFACRLMPLSVCWRCDASMIRLAQTTGAPIQVAPGKPEGRTETLATYNTVPGDVVLCRTTAPLIGACYRLISQGQPAVVLGKDIGAGLTALVKKLRAKSINELSQKLSRWLQDEIASAEENGKPHKSAAAEDKAECLQVIIDQLPSSKRTIDSLLSVIEDLFEAEDYEGRAVIFSTIHKAKGREWDRVIILDREQMPLKWAKTDWQKKQEVHCMYVAFTRAKHELFFVSSKTLNKDIKGVALSLSEDEGTEASTDSSFFD